MSCQRTVRSIAGCQLEGEWAARDVCQGMDFG